MSLYENTSTRPLAERSQTAKRVIFANEKTKTLYPSLPSIDRFDALVADRSVEEELHLALPPAEKQSDAAACSEARWKAQILNVEEQNRELLSINERWAEEYSTMRQYYKERVQHLEALLQQDYSQFEEMCEGKLNTKTYVKFKLKTLKDTKSSTTDMSSELLKAKQEAEELREQNNTLTRRGQHQAEEIRRLNKALQEALETTKPAEVSEETLQEVWKQQAEVYKEDFLKERKDREKLKEKCLDLEKKFKKVHSELRFLKSQVKWTLAPQPVPECKCKTLAKSPNWEVQHINQHHMVLQRH